MGGGGYIGEDFLKRTGRYTYRMVWAPAHPNATATGHILEHRLVASRKIGRPLRRTEVVHHVNENTLDNHPDNLEVIGWVGDHTRKHKPRNRVTVRCEHCGIEKERKRADSVRRAPAHFFCSKACLYAYRRANMTSLACLVCSATFTLCAAHARRSKGYCSHGCQNEARRRAASLVAP